MQLPIVIPTPDLTQRTTTYKGQLKNHDSVHRLVGTPQDLENHPECRFVPPSGYHILGNP